LQFDAIVVGGSYAGIAAALQLARARRAVLVVDAGIRRNRFAVASHGFLGQDGRAPEAIVQDAKGQLTAYPNVTWIDGAAAEAAQEEDGFRIRLADGAEHVGKRLVLATGVVDELPPIPGLAERWGQSVFHCPYCHGYELDNGRIGVLATGPWAMHQATMLPDWGPTTLFTNEAFEPSAEDLEELRRRGVALEAEPVAEIVGERCDLRLRDGRIVALEGLFTATRTRVASPLAEQLGCAYEDAPLGAYIRTELAMTSVPGVFACGDAARPTGSVSLAVRHGALAGVAAHRSRIVAP